MDNPEFLGDDHLLFTPVARALYHGVARDLPVIDYHNHLSVRDIAADRRFDNLTQLWLEADHYKWRAMRANGVPEDRITGRATTDRQKFDAWAATVPHTLRNPLHTWTHLELRRTFGITELLEPASADRIWNLANERLRHGDLTVHGLLRRARVSVLCTTDDPADSLADHERIAASDLPTRVYPTFRPDAAFGVDDASVFNAWCDRLAAAAGRDIATMDDFLDALERRHEAFHRVGCRLSDHGLETVFATEASEAELRAIFAKVRAGADASPGERDRFGTRVMLHVGRLNAARGWTLQLHVGPIRNLNTRLRRRLGADAGADAIGDAAHARPLAWFLDRLDRDDALPKTIVYNLNPRDNAMFAALLGCFQDGSFPGKVQYGAAWWFLDQEAGIRAHLETLSQLGMLSRFVGMLTDSRSFLSFSRHELFRRILCSTLGEDVATGRLPNRPDLLRPLVADLCHDNASRHFGFECGRV